MAAIGQLRNSGKITSTNKLAALLAASGLKYPVASPPYKESRHNKNYRGMLARMEREGHLWRGMKFIRPERITALCGKVPTALHQGSVRRDAGIGR
jgi:hypothetical protein